MNSPTRDSTQICVPCATEYDNHDPITECAVEFLEGAIAAIKRGSQYNTGFAYKDYMTSGVTTAVDRCVEPMMRIMATRKIDQCYDHLAYVALGISYFLAGCPPSKIQISTGSVVKPDIQSINEEANAAYMEILKEDDLGDKPPHNHDFSSKLTGDVE